MDDLISLKRKLSRHWMLQIKNLTKNHEQCDWKPNWNLKKKFKYGSEEKCI